MTKRKFYNPNHPILVSPEEVPVLRRMARAGDAEAQNTLGRCYLYGEAGVKANPRKARAWFEHAAAQGLVKAKYNLGLFLDNPRLRHADRKRWATYLVEAVMEGYPAAMYLLSLLWDKVARYVPLLDERVNFTISLQNGHALLLRSVFKGYAPAQRALSLRMMYHAAQDGDPLMAYLLARVFQHDGKVQEALKYLDMAAPYGFAIPELEALRPATQVAVRDMPE